jgi:hypothetical protein
VLIGFFQARAWAEEKEHRHWTSVLLGEIFGCKLENDGETLVLRRACFFRVLLDHSKLRPPIQYHSMPTAPKVAPVP